ncbi:hypothetical protein VOA_003275 [Vibrio sp. RC586]|nr:hypothetical protein VOA_003275 [Vibrio sp. RC586]
MYPKENRAKSREVIKAHKKTRLNSRVFEPHPVTLERIFPKGKINA